MCVVFFFYRLTFAFSFVCQVAICRLRGLLFTCYSGSGVSRLSVLFWEAFRIHMKKGGKIFGLEDDHKFEGVCV